MFRRIGLLSALATVSGLTLTAGPTSAVAATTIGSNLNASASFGFACIPNCTVSHSSLPAASQAAGGLLAPQDGVVVRWRVKVGTATPPLALRITRPGNSNTRTGAGTGPTVPVSANQTSTFEARLPIQAGNAIGLDCCANDPTYAFATTTDAVTLRWLSFLVDGGLARTGSAEDRELLLNADIEPDADHDSFGDETQDLCPTNAATQGPCAVSPIGPAASVTGQRAAAVKKCKKKAKKNDWTKKRLKKCKKKANLLPV